MKFFAIEAPLVSIDDLSRMHMNSGKKGGTMKGTYKHASGACVSLDAFLEFSMLIVGELFQCVSVCSSDLYYFCRFVMLGHQSLWNLLLSCKYNLAVN